MRDLENGGWMPWGWSTKKAAWSVHVTWSNWQWVFGMEFSHDDSARWAMLGVGPFAVFCVREEMA